jgi:hypothetical protein
MYVTIAHRNGIADRKVQHVPPSHECKYTRRLTIVVHMFKTRTMWYSCTNASKVIGVVAEQKVNEREYDENEQKLDESVVTHRIEKQNHTRTRSKLKQSN